MLYLLNCTVITNRSRQGRYEELGHKTVFDQLYSVKGSIWLIYDIWKLFFKELHVGFRFEKSLL